MMFRIIGLLLLLVLFLSSFTTIGKFEYEYEYIWKEESYEWILSIIN